MPKKQTYADLGDACATAHAMDVIGDRWSMVIARELLLGPRRFADLASAVVGITPAVLTARLKALRDSGVEGRVVATFVVDAEGRARDVEAQASHAAFAQAVREVLPRWRFQPARDASGRAVAAPVRQVFRFRIGD